jgi:hypothetical protein
MKSDCIDASHDGIEIGDIERRDRRAATMSRDLFDDGLRLSSHEVVDDALGSDPSERSRVASARFCPPPVTSEQRSSRSNS